MVTEIARALVAANAYLDITSDNGETPLDFALGGNYAEIAKLLIEKGGWAKISLGSALRIASSNGHDETVKLLLANGVDVNAKSGNGYTALMLALENDHIEIVKFLVSSGADVNTEDNIGWTALMEASRERIH